MTVGDYYKHFISIWGGLAALISSTPLIAIMLPADYSLYLFPPLGAYEVFFKVATLITIAIVTILVFFTKDTQFVMSKAGRPKCIAVCLILVFVALVVLLALDIRFIRKVDIKSEHKDIVVSVGFERTAFAKSQFPDTDDWDLLRQRGAEEQEIDKLWTFRSIVAVRLFMFASYLLFILSAVGSTSLGVLFDKLGAATLP